MNRQIKSSLIVKFLGFLLAFFWLTKTPLPFLTNSLNVPEAPSFHGQPVSILREAPALPQDQIRPDADQSSLHNWIKIGIPDDPEFQSMRIIRKTKRPNDFQVLEPFSIDSNLKKRQSLLTAKLIDNFFEQKNSALKGIGQAVINASQKYGINATYIMAHAILETAWGKSKIYRENNNLFGWGAFDGTPWASSKKFPSREVCIDYVMGRIDLLYLRANGKYFKTKSSLGNKTYGMNVYYASDPKWGQKIAHIAQGIEEKIF